MSGVIRIGTRKSALALVQTETVKEKIEAAFPDIRAEVIGMSTKGDELLDRSLTSFGGKGVFTKELEEALLSGEIDLAVHSAKDLPMEFPAGLHIGAVLQRADARDVLVTKDGTPLLELTPGSVVGTGSLRRELQIKRLNPLVRVKLIRGNVQTRLRKLAEGQYDAIVLAAAGLERLGLTHEESGTFHFEYLEPDRCLPAAGQGILAVECREGHLREVLETIHDSAAAVCLSAERAFLSAVGGSCNAPAAAFSYLDGDTLHMDALYASDMTHIKRVRGSAETGADPDSEKGAQLGRSLAKKVRQGKVWLVGAGPGDMRLVTRKCLRVIQEADVIVYDSLATDALLNEAKREAEFYYAGKRASHHYLKQEETNALLIQKAREGKNVARLKGGDPFVFGRGGEEAQELVRAGIEFEIVPGVSSCYGAPAYAGIPVTHRDCASSFHVITGHEGAHKEAAMLNYATLAKEEGTLVFLMGLKNLSCIVKNLTENGKAPGTPAAVIQEGSTARQRVVTGTLGDIAEEAERAGIRTPAITVVGDVAALYKELDWFGKGPLSGKRVLVTATEKMAEKFCGTLEAEGAECIPFSLIYTKPLLTEELSRAVEHLEEYSWLVFTSANGVNIFFDYLITCGRDIRCLSGVKIAVIGSGTEGALRVRGILADFVPEKYSSRDMAAEWTPTLTVDDRVLMLRAREASPELNRALEGAGIPYMDVPLYCTAVDERKKGELSRILPETDYVIFASASAAKAFASMTAESDSAAEESAPVMRGQEALAKRGLAAKIVCIGPATERAAREAGLSVYRSAVEYTAEGIRDVLLYAQARIGKLAANAACGPCIEQDSTCSKDCSKVEAGTV